MFFVSCCPSGPLSASRPPAPLPAVPICRAPVVCTLASASTYRSVHAHGPRLPYQTPNPFPPASGSAWTPIVASSSAGDSPGGGRPQQRGSGSSSSSSSSGAFQQAPSTKLQAPSSKLQAPSRISRYPENPIHRPFSAFSPFLIDVAHHPCKTKCTPTHPHISPSPPVSAPRLRLALSEHRGLLSDHIASYRITCATSRPTFEPRVGPSANNSGGQKSAFRSPLLSSRGAPTLDARRSTLATGREARSPGPVLYAVCAVLCARRCPPAPPLPFSLVSRPRALSPRAYFRSTSYN